jgi:hypothetical protein
VGWSWASGRLSASSVTSRRRSWRCHRALSMLNINANTTPLDSARSFRWRCERRWLGRRGSWGLCVTPKERQRRFPVFLYFYKEW